MDTSDIYTSRINNTKPITLVFTLLPSGVVLLHMGEKRIPILGWKDVAHFATFVDGAITARNQFYPSILQEAEGILRQDGYL